MTQPTGRPRTRKKLLWVGDACCPSGFARSTHAILEAVRQYYDVTVLGINYRGDPHSYQYPVYAAGAGGDFLGVNRLVWMMDLVKPDVVVLQNDFWNITRYMAKLRQFAEYRNIPVIGYIAVDGKNADGETLNGLTKAIFWTKFAEDEAKAGGCSVPTEVIPLGVDTTLYQPMDKLVARSAFPWPKDIDPAKLFIVGNVNRNQPRKRFDLVIRYFAEWVHEKKVDNALLMLHVAPTGDEGFNIQHLAKYYGVADRLMTIAPEVFYGLSDEEVRTEYCSWDVALTATQGEGFGLTTFEAMACGTPVIAPDWSALGDLCRDAAMLVPCTSTAATIGSSVIGGVMDERSAIETLDLVYRSPELRADLRHRGLLRAREPRFNWLNIGRAFTSSIHKTLQAREEVAV